MMAKCFACCLMCLHCLMSEHNELIAEWDDKMNSALKIIIADWNGPSPVSCLSSGSRSLNISTLIIMVSHISIRLYFKSSTHMLRKLHWNGSIQRSNLDNCSSRIWFWPPRKIIAPRWLVRSGKRVARIVTLSGLLSPIKLPNKLCRPQKCLSVTT